MTAEDIRLAMAIATLGFSFVGLIFAALTIWEVLKIRRIRRGRDPHNR